MQVVALLSGALCAAHSADLPPHPRLLLDQDGIARLKRRIDSCDWAKSSWQSLKKRADSLLAKNIELPPRGGNWGSWHACPTHGVKLTKGNKLGPWQWEHVCPVDKEVFKGDPATPSRDYDGCSISGVHSEWSQAVRNLGVVYQVTGDKRYAAKAREILLAYASAYGSYPLHNASGEPKTGGGKRGAGSLDESTWLIPICQGADLVWDTLSDGDRRAVADKLLLAAVKEVILPNKMGIGNIQCWKNSAVGLVGLLLGDTDLIHEAIENPDRGYRVQMAKGVTADGGWWEGAWGYHFYTMSALRPLTEAARNCGIDLYGPEFKRMFDAPLRFATPNMKLPAFSDSSEQDLVGSRGFYELGYARYHDPAYLTFLSRGDRTSDYALWFGEPDLPPKAPGEGRKSANYPVSGYAILTRGKGEDATWLCLKYGPYGGGHAHPDKLSFILYSRGQVIAIDPGYALYGLAVQWKWFRTTLAHNTLVVDEESQEKVDGKLISFGSKDGVDHIVADAGAIYEGVRFVRTAALLDPNLIVIVDQVTSDKDRVLDIAYHQRGAWLDLPKGDPWTPPDKPGYNYLKDATLRKLTGPTTLTTRIADNWSAAVTIDPGEAADLITATGITSGTQDRVPCAIVRRTGRESTVVWAIALDGKPALVERISVARLGEPGPAPVSLRVTGGDGRAWTLTAGVKQ